MRKSRATAGLSILLALCSLVLSGCLGRQMSAAEVVRNTQQALGEMRACHAVLKVNLDTEMFQESLAVELWERYPEQLRVDILSASSPQLAGMAFTTDGETSILYSPHTRTATIGSADVVRMPQVIETIVDARRLWLEQADPAQARLFAKVRENGLMVYKIDLAHGQNSAARITIDAHRWWVRRIEYQEEYAGQNSIVWESMECPANLDDALLDIDIPEGATLEEVRFEDNPPLTLVEAQTKFGFRLRIPNEAVLPPDTRFMVAYQLDKNMALVYTGAHPFTLVQGPNIGAVPEQNATQVVLSRGRGTLIDDPEHNGLLLTWREGELQFSIAGSLDRATLETIANGLE